MKKELIEKALEFVKDIIENDFSGHDYFHTLRVYKMAINIAMKENANLEIVQLSALLHDVDDIKLSPQTHKNKENAVRFLKSNNVSEEEINIICEIIDEVSFAGGNLAVPKTIEG